MTDIQFLEDIKQEDFANSSTKFNKMSYVSLEEEPDNYGLTPFGFKQLIKQKLASNVD